MNNIGLKMIVIVLAMSLSQSVAQVQIFVEVRVGDTANLTMTGQVQTSNLVCIRNGQALTFSGRYGIVANPGGTQNLTISQVTKDDYGRYSCILNSDATTLIYFEVVVVDPIYMVVNQVTYNLNDNVTVMCNATFYMTANLMLDPSQDLILYMVLNGKPLANDSSLSKSVTSTRTRNLIYSGNAVEDMRSNNVTCQLKSSTFLESASQRVNINTPPKEAKIANKSMNTFYPGQTLVCTVDSYPLLTVNWNKLNVPCSYPPTPFSQTKGIAILTMTANCIGQQTWSCSASWDLVTIVNDTITFNVVTSSENPGNLSDNAGNEKRNRDIGLGVGLGLGIPLLILIAALIIFCCRSKGDSNVKTQKAQAIPKKATAPPVTTNPNPNPNFHALPSYNQVAKSGNGVVRGAPGVPDIGVAHLNGSGSIPQLNSSLDGQISFTTRGGAINLGKADLGAHNPSFTNI